MPKSRFSARAVLLVFLLGAALDFVLGYLQWHSLSAGVTWIVGGSFVTAFFLFLYRASSRNDSSGPDDAPPGA
jgi:hypothetical protein